MADTIRELFLTPAIAIARLGGSSVPQDAFTWVQSPNPRSNAETVIAPAWSLTVEADGTVTPHMPTTITLRDGALIRPVAPFVEIWVRLGEPQSARDTWREAPLTLKTLAAIGLSVSDLVVRVTAVNAKAARRTGNTALRFGTFPQVEIKGDDHRNTPLLAVSPLGTSKPMIPKGKNISLGFVQVLRSREQPTAGTTLWEKSVNVEVLRIRFTPARGHVYGPPQSAQEQTTPRGQNIAPVDPTRAFLRADAGWAEATVNSPVVPGDTYDGADVDSRSNRSLGVVDDTCEARVQVSLKAPKSSGTLSATCTIFVAPPDFAPDRRPFLSLADELNDRSADVTSRNASMTGDDHDRWVEDLFERIQEVVSLLNVDLWRAQRAARLTGSQVADPIPGDQVLPPTRAMGGRDGLRDRLYALAAPNATDPLPLTKHARMRHRALADLEELRTFVQQHPGRLKQLIRSPFDVRTNETADVTTMAMPPFMRNSNALPLTLSAWQYNLLMDWVDAVEAPHVQAAPTALTEFLVSPAAPSFVRARAPMSAAAIERREAVLNRVRGTTGKNP